MWSVKCLGRRETDGNEATRPGLRGARGGPRPAFRFGRGSDGIQMAHSLPTRLAHTLVKFFIESCMVYLLVAGFTKRTDR